MRILHRTVVISIILNKMGVTANIQCDFCNNAKDRIEHISLKCACIRRFLDFAAKQYWKKSGKQRQM